MYFGRVEFDNGSHYFREKSEKLKVKMLFNSKNILHINCYGFLTGPGIVSHYAYGAL